MFIYVDTTSERLRCYKKARATFNKQRSKLPFSATRGPGWQLVVRDSPQYNKNVLFHFTAASPRKVSLGKENQWWFEKCIRATAEKVNALIRNFSKTELDSNVAQIDSRMFVQFGTTPMKIGRNYGQFTKNVTEITPQIIQKRI